MGYKAKVQYQPVDEAEKEAKREAVAKVMLQALKGMKEKRINAGGINDPID